MLILGGISGAGMTAILEDYRPVFLTVTVGLLGMAFYLTYRPRPAASATRMAAVNKVMLWGVTAIVIVFLFFPQVITDLIPSSDRFTPDMEVTVIRIEGMT